MNGKGEGQIVTVSSQVSGLEDLGKISVQPYHKGIKDAKEVAAEGRLRPTSSARKIGGGGGPRYVDITRCGVNS
jgi:hypothetical protein